MKRRAFLKMSAAAGAATLVPNAANALWIRRLHGDNAYRWAVPELFRRVPKPPAFSKALVIGSGFGGAITSLRLAQAGIKVTMLERGMHWPNSPHRQIFSDEARPDGRGYWHTTQTTQLLTGQQVNVDYFGGVLDQTKYQNLEVWRGAAVGGGSIVYTGVSIQPRQDYFEALFGDVVDFTEMDQVYYPRARQMLNVSAMPADVYNAAPFGHSRVWDQQVATAGYSSFPIDSIFQWDTVRAEINGDVRQSATIGESNTGNSNGAKYDLNQNYLKLAQATGNLDIYQGQQVLAISQDDKGRYLVDVSKIDPFGNELDRYTLACEYLFLAAGSIGTSELLVRARAKGDLAALNEHVGEGWGTNGDTAMLRSFSPIQGLRQGAPSASAIHVTDSGIPTTVENWYVPALLVNLGLIGSLGIAFDQSTRGAFSYDSSTDKVDLSWPENGNADALAAALAINGKIADASHSVAGLGSLAPSASSTFTAHPLGGAILGLAADAYGRVMGYDKLYVMDGAMVPGNTGAVNPSLTISALAERNIENILQNDW
jgi:cholesterol oxidase